LARPACPVTGAPADVGFRPYVPRDDGAVRRVVDGAFRPEDVVTFVDALRADGCLIGEWIAEDARGPVGYIAFARVWIATPAGANCASIVEAYPRADAERTKDDNAFYGTEALFRRAGFDVVRGPLADRPRAWPTRLAMRRTPGA